MLALDLQNVPLYLYSDKTQNPYTKAHFQQIWQYHNNATVSFLF